MAIITVPDLIVPAWVPLVQNTQALTSENMNATGEKVAFVITIPRTGTLNRVGFLVGTVGNNPDNGLRVSFQDVDASGNPDGSQDQYRDLAGPFTSTTWQTTGLMTDNGTDGGVKRSVTRGAMMSIVVEFVSFVASDSININTIAVPTGVGPANSYVLSFGASWAKTNQAAPLVALQYDDNAYDVISPYVLPALAMTSTAFNSGSTPDERALRFQLDVEMRCSGAYINADLDGAADVVLYDSGGSVLASSAVVVTARRITSAQWWFVSFATPVSLSAATTYYLSLKPTSVTNITTYSFSVNSTDLMRAVGGGDEWYLATRTDAGAWSTTTTERPYYALIFDGIETGGSGGGGESPSAYFG